ncbi:ABC transporter ATP-binding protein [Alkalihalobacillus sp. LMS39]|uniref:ABC transporter ATP-binding protein n=1 Tax=Alkalihalobacillus sp. LMS39 TaxID=2924032 RepID=UPI001FB2C154|nr:ABC transporter ATP-binding protein [Alkalihalobacillus sp. LMS39]UOE94675.1 ABC transporter ATP-binding protein [Alkalihalobacillus sp. LMS39]
MKIVEVENVSKSYQSKNNEKTYEALRHISFHIEKGEFVGIMGSSGSGKTTLLNVLGSLDKPTSGTIKINDKDVISLKKDELAKHRVENIGFIFQDYNLLETMTLKENIILPLALQEQDSEVLEEKLTPLVKKLGIEEVIDKYPYEVSGGQQQRAAACRALITNPAIILADEPTGNLDSASSEDLLLLLQEMNEHFQVTILMVTHDVFAASYCERILFIKDGVFIDEVKKQDNNENYITIIMSKMRVLGGKSS